MGNVSESIHALRLLTHANSWTFFHNYQRMLESLLRQLLELGLYPLLAWRKGLDRSWISGRFFSTADIVTVFIYVLFKDGECNFLNTFGLGS